MPNQPNSKNSYFGIILSIILCLLWMLITGIIGALGWYEYQRSEPHLWIVISVLMPTILFVFLFAFLPSVRTWTQRLNLAMLSLPHAWRTVGFTFLALWFYGILPAGFAAPAGFGDFAIGIAAPFVVIALWLQWANAIRAAIWFHLLGLTDLFFAILTGATGFGVPLEEMSNIDPMTTFPMVIIPTVFVPLLTVSHVMALTKIVMDKRAIA